jgi:hypothetical protein
MKLSFSVAVFLVLFLILPEGATAQESFGFGDSENFGFPASPGPSASIGGEASAELKVFIDELDSGNEIKEIRLGDIFSGSLNFKASASIAEAAINLNLAPRFEDSSPVEIDEAYVRAFFGPLAITGGFKKITWGKADSFGPLDLVNPLDYSDLSNLSDPQSVKIARPMVHAAWSIGSFSKLEAVFVPWFQGHRLAPAGRWAPNQMDNLRNGVKETLTGMGAARIEQLLLEGQPMAAMILKDVLENSLPEEIESEFQKRIDEGIYPETNTLEYAQAGIRFTTSIGSSDFGLQYYFGRLPRPSVNIVIADGFIDGLLVPPHEPDLGKISIFVDYNWYHHIGIDFARVIAGFNLRAEAGANITGDLDGTDGSIYNPSLVWSLGFDRDLFAGINLNLQGTGKLRFFHGNIGNDIFTDCEAGSTLSSTRITGIVSRKFLRDELELKTSALWGIEDRDFLIMPGIYWSRNDVKVGLSAGFFGGDKEGELGQYRDNGFVKLTLSYNF